MSFVCQSELTEIFSAELTEFAAELSEFSLPKFRNGTLEQYSAHFLI